MKQPITINLILSGILEPLPAKAHPLIHLMKRTWPTFFSTKNKGISVLYNPV